MPDERWLYVPEHGCLYALDELTGEPVRHYPVAVTSYRYGPRLQRLPDFERLTRGFVASHDEDCEFRGSPACTCDLCTEGRTLLGLAKPEGGDPC